MSSAPYIEMVYSYNMMVANRGVHNTNGVNNTNDFTPSLFLSLWL